MACGGQGGGGAVGREGKGRGEEYVALCTQSDILD